MTPTFEDPRLQPIREKVEAGERLDFEDGLALYRSPDLLGVGWMANRVRERLHGNDDLFQRQPPHQSDRRVRRQLQAVRVRQDAPRIPRRTRCRSSRCGKRAGHGYSEAVTEFHIVGGLHPELTLDWYCQMLRGLKQRFPQVHLKAFTMVEIGYFAQRAKLTPREVLERLKDAGMDSMPGGGAEIFSRARAADHLRSQDHRRAVAGRRAHRAPARAAFQLHHALRPHRDRRGSRRSPAETARAAGRDAAAS